MDFFWGYLVSGIIIFITIIIALVAQIKVMTSYSKYRQVPSSLNMTGQEFAEKLIRERNLPLQVRACGGSLTDHYDPRDRSINISQENFSSQSIASQAIIAHEFGHALQHEENYLPFKIRQIVVKSCNFISSLLVPLILIGILIQFFWLAGFGLIFIYASVGIYGVSVIANLATLPVEFNASKRAKQVMEELGINSDEERKAIDSVLNSAAMTYVASLLVSMAYLLRYLFILLSITKRD